MHELFAWHRTCPQEGENEKATSEDDLIGTLTTGYPSFKEAGLGRVRLVLWCWPKLGALLHDLGCITWYHIDGKCGILHSPCGVSWKNHLCMFWMSCFRWKGWFHMFWDCWRQFNLSPIEICPSSTCQLSTLGQEAFWCWKPAVLQRDLRLRTGLEWDTRLSRISQGS